MAVGVIDEIVVKCRMDLFSLIRAQSFDQIESEKFHKYVLIILNVFTLYTSTAALGAMCDLRSRLFLVFDEVLWVLCSIPFIQ